MHDSATTTERFAVKYDTGFFISVSILTSIVSRFVGADPVLLIGGILGVLAFPWVLGSITYQRIVIARLLPNDMTFSEWYAPRSAPARRDTSSISRP
jgi:hypothetical protein